MTTEEKAADEKLAVGCCANCVFWLEMPTKNPAQKGTMGLCRVNPPTPMQVMVPVQPTAQEILQSGGRAQPQMGMTIQAHFPATGAAVWCGAHEYDEEAPPAQDANGDDLLDTSAQETV